MIIVLLIDYTCIAGECKSQSSNECLTSREGTKCVWANNAMCLTPSDGQTRLLNKNVMDVKSGQCPPITGVYQGY